MENQDILKRLLLFIQTCINWFGHLGSAQQAIHSIDLQYCKADMENILANSCLQYLSIQQTWSDISIYPESCLCPPGKWKLNMHSPFSSVLVSSPNFYLSLPHNENHLWPKLWTTICQYIRGSVAILTCFTIFKWSNHLQIWIHWVHIDIENPNSCVFFWFVFY